MTVAIYLPWKTEVDIGDPLFSPFPNLLTMNLLCLTASHCLLYLGASYMIW